MLKAVSGEDKANNAEWTDWCMKDLVLDVYRLRYAERLALKDIPEARLAAYRYLFDRARYFSTSFGRSGDCDGWVRFSLLFRMENLVRIL